jgi:hypothetical protein
MPHCKRLRVLPYYLEEFVSSGDAVRYIHFSELILLEEDTIPDEDNTISLLL